MSDIQKQQVRTRLLIAINDRLYQSNDITQEQYTLADFALKKRLL